MQRLIIYITYLILLLSINANGASDQFAVRHYQHQDRYEFGEKLLKLALSNTGKPYHIIEPKGQTVNEARGELLVIQGDLDIQWLSTSQEREDKLIPIRIPVYRGILGLRLLLVTNENHQELSKIRTLEDLRKYTGGHGLHWQDLPVYKANQLPVKTYSEYNALFRQLENQRFDYFHRGINEIWGEHKRFNKTLSIADNIMLFYAHPVYFFVSKHRPALANDIKKGLRKALKEGTFKRLFLGYHQDMLDKADLRNRTLIRLKNPVVTDNNPIMQTDWWLPRELLE